MHERRCDNSPLMLHDKCVPCPLIGGRKHPIDRGQTLRVTVRLVEVGLEHDMQRIVEEPLGNNARHFGNIVARSGSTLHGPPPSSTWTYGQFSIENRTAGRYLSSYGIDTDLALSTRRVSLCHSTFFHLTIGQVFSRTLPLVALYPRTDDNRVVHNRRTACDSFAPCAPRSGHYSSCRRYRREPTPPTGRRCRRRSS